MVSLPRDKVDKFLNRIGTLTQGKRHKKYIVKIGKEREFLVPFIMGSQKDIGNELISSLAEELRIQKKDLIQLVRTKGKKKDYIRAYKKNATNT